MHSGLYILNKTGKCVITTSGMIHDEFSYFLYRKETILSLNQFQND
jgi:hypothetical protein